MPHLENLGQSRQSYRQKPTLINIWGKNPLQILLFTQNSLQIKFVPLLPGSKPAKLSYEIKKDDKVGNKNGHKNKGKEEKKKREKRSKQIRQILSYADGRKTKKAACIQLAKNYVFSVSNLKGNLWSKMR